MTSHVLETTALNLVRANDPSWLDVSNYVVHFAKPFEGRSAYDNMMSILSNMCIRAVNPFGVGRNIAPEPESQKVACFSETPLHYLGRIANRRSEFGIVFRKDFIVSRGGNPSLYAYRDQTLANAIRSMMAFSAGDPTAPIWSVTPFVDETGGSYNFEWEREWRHVGDLHFTPDDVAFLIIPEESHFYARDFFQSAEQDQLGPNYPCPFIDARWNREQVLAVLS